MNFGDSNFSLILSNAFPLHDNQPAHLSAPDFRLSIRLDSITKT